MITSLIFSFEKKSDLYQVDLIMPSQDADEATIVQQALSKDSLPENLLCN
jgi:hypothetical protein